MNLHTNLICLDAEGGEPNLYAFSEKISVSKSSSSEQKFKAVLGLKNFNVFFGRPGPDREILE